jgi:hypothetical protein
MAQISKYKEISIMKRFLTIALIAAVAISFSSCKKKGTDEPKKEEAAKAATVPMADLVKYLPKLDKGLSYEKYSTTGTFLHIYVAKGKTRVLWFQMFDQRNDQATKDGYKTATFKVGKYPAKKMDNKFVWALINNIEIRAVADDKAKDFQNTDKIVKFLQKFNLAGLEKL